MTFWIENINESTPETKYYTLSLPQGLKWKDGKIPSMSNIAWNTKTNQYLSVMYYFQIDNEPVSNQPHDNDSDVRQFSEKYTPSHNKIFHLFGDCCNVRHTGYPVIFWTIHVFSAYILELQKYFGKCSWECTLYITGSMRFWMLHISRDQRGVTRAQACSPKTSSRKTSATLKFKH